MGGTRLRRQIDLDLTRMLILGLLPLFQTCSPWGTEKVMMMSSHLVRDEPVLPLPAPEGLIPALMAVKEDCPNLCLTSRLGCKVPADVSPRSSKNNDFVEKVAEGNVRLVMQQIREGSPILRQMLDKHEIGLVGGIYDLSTGEVHFFDK